MPNILPFPEEVGRRNPDLGSAPMKICQSNQSDSGEVLKFPHPKKSTPSNGEGVVDGDLYSSLKDIIQDAPDQSHR